jgi:sulfoxide reductase heme-binding subunit YedZ
MDKQRVRIRKTSPWLRVAIHLAGWLPLLVMLYDGLTNNLSINPIQEIVQRLGRFALYFLSASLACTPLNTLFGWRELLKHRRALGLYAFLYAALHFYVIVAVDYGFNWNQLREIIFTKPYALVGFVTGLVLLALAITSFDVWKKRLGKNWKRLHALVYLAGLLAVLHYAWAKKGNIFTLSGDIIRPLIFGVILIILLSIRIPAIKRWIAQGRQAIKARTFRAQKNLSE